MSIVTHYRRAHQLGKEMHQKLITIMQHQSGPKVLKVNYLLNLITVLNNDKFDFLSSTLNIWFPNIVV